MKKIKLFDGINILFALQGQGKSYCATYIAVQTLLQNSTRKVLSNYPIIFERPLTFRQRLINYILNLLKCDKKIIKYLNITLNRQIPEILQTYKWEDSFTGTAIKDCIIIIDESHDKYTGAYAYELNKHDRKFFSRLRHNHNIVMLMSQSFEDIHPFIRRRTAFIHEIKKRKWVFLKNPSCFFIETYISIKNYMNKDLHKINKNAEKTMFLRQKVPFNLLTGTAYNTHYYKDIRIEPELTLWTDELEGKTVPSKFNIYDSSEEEDYTPKKKRKKAVESEDEFLE